MTTEAGRRLQGQLAYDRNPEWYLPGDIDTRYDDEIAAIEAEARAALLAELEAGVLTELTHDKVAARMQAVGRPWTVGEAVKASGDIVLDLIQQVTSK